jgi:hypothetical protein
MVRLRWDHLAVIITTMGSSAHGKVLYHGTCALKTDPKIVSQGLVSLCLNAEAGAITGQKSVVDERDSQPPIALYGKGEASLFLTPFLSLHALGHTETLLNRIDRQTLSRESRRDALVVQIGNNALSRHRLSSGRGRPATSIDHQQRSNMEFIWNLEKFETPPVNFVSYTYDNQLDWTVQMTYGRLLETEATEAQKTFGAGRIMYDIAALEGTRIVLGGFGDGRLRRSVHIGMLNVNGRGDETAIEIIRQFGLYPYDPKEFRQQIRLSYLSREQSQSRLKFQYDDVFRRVRIGGIGGIYYLLRYMELESHIGFAKREDNAKFSHWFITMRLGVRT